MSTFATADEVYELIGGMFRDALAEPGIGDELAASGVVLELRLTDPESSITVDMPNRAVHCGPGYDGHKPSMSLRASADTAHEYWLGQVNVGVAVAKGRIKVKGSVPTLLRLAGLAKPLFPRYRQRFAATTGGS